VAKRSYHQYCGLAAALDVVAERWAMLVIRDLTPGPRRFSDLFDGLPGIATDVLAERLRSLEAAGAVRQRRLRYPAPANVYELTDRGRELAAIGGRLAEWGQDLLPSPEGTDYRLNPRWALQSMVAGYRGEAPEGGYVFEIDGDELTVAVTDGSASVAYGPVDDPLVRVTCSARAFFRMARQPSSTAALPASVKVAGEVADLRALLEAMPLTVGTSRPRQPA
jgi:DNA-binding HxlR family transcriptional regulator